MASLQSLLGYVDSSWPDIADHLPNLETMYEDEKFPLRNLAAYIASKVYFHLESFSDSMRFALAAGSLFDLSDLSEYTLVITSRLVDEYVRLRDSEAVIDPKHEDLISSLVSICLQREEFKTGLGIAIEANRLDWVEKFVVESGNIVGMLSFILENMRTLNLRKGQRHDILKLVLNVFKTESNERVRDWCGLAQCYFVLEDIQAVASLFEELLNSANQPWGKLMAYQVAFDLSDNENQRFCQELVKKFPCEAQFTELVGILSGTVQTRLHLEFLCRNNKTDSLILDTLRSSADHRSSIVHNALVLSHSLMQCGTCDDSFLRNNLDWWSKSVQWAKFTATASLGVVHKGHTADSRNVLSAYLPSSSSGGARRTTSSSSFTEGGALYALGLVHANLHDVEIQKLLIDQLEASKEDEVVQVGASLGLGLTCLATRDADVLRLLKTTLFCDNAVSGEAAAYAIGLVLAGSSDEKTSEEILQYAKDTQHERISRACVMAVSLINFSGEQEAEPFIHRMCNDADSVIRYGGVFTLGMAYCGTADNNAIRRLLHYSVSDVSDDIRRAAVISLGFVLCGEPRQLPKVLKLLSESYNPHVRYGVCLALGVGCAGKVASVPEALEVIEPLTKDAVDFVRQGAYIGVGLICQETSDKQAEGKAAALRQVMIKLATEKTEEPLVRFGIILGLGLMDVSGRNACTSFFTRTGERLRLAGAVGLCLFSQVWYWFPLSLMVSLAASPTSFIGLNGSLKIPRIFAMKTRYSNVSLFAYSSPMKPIEKIQQAKLVSAVLSTAGRTRRGNSMSQQLLPQSGNNNTIRLSATAGKEDTASIAATAGSHSAAGGGAGDTDELMLSAEERKQQKLAQSQQQPSPSLGPIQTSLLYNPFRVVPGQEKLIDTFKASETMKFPDTFEKVRYVPLLPQRKCGFVLLEDLRNGEPEEILEFSSNSQSTTQATTTAQQVVPSPQVAEQQAPSTNAPLPEEFEWTEE